MFNLYIIDLTILHSLFNFEIEIYIHFQKRDLIILYRNINNFIFIFTFYSM